MKPLKLLIFSSLFLYFLNACTSTQAPNDGTNPKAPKESYEYTDKQVENFKQISTINIPFEITMADVERQINTQIQGLIYEDNSFEDDNADNFQCKVWKVSPITVTAVKDTFFFNVPLKIWVNYRVQLLGMSQTKDTEFQLKLRFASKFSLQPNWEAKTQTSANGFEWLSKPVLKLGPITLPISSIVSKVLTNKQEKMYAAIDESISKNIEVKKYVLQAWNTAQTPYLVSEKYRTWFKLVPQEILMTPLLTANNRVKATIGIRANAETTFGEKPLVPTVLDIPDLKLVKDVPDDFKVGLMAEISHEEASRMLADTMIGQKFSFQNGKFNVEVTSIDVYGANNKVVIKTGLKGSMNGLIYFKGVPYYEPSTKSLSLKEFDYDLETKNVLLKTANWIFQGKFAKNMQEAFTFPIGSQISDTQRQLQAYITNNKVAKGVVLNGKIENITPDKVYLTPTSFIAVVLANGKIDLKIDGL